MSVLLQVKNVTKRFPGVIALKDVNIELHSSEILGICGENGAGKSTLMKVLSGAYPAGTYEGELYLDGKPAIFRRVADSQAAGIEMIYQEINVMLDSSIAENIFVGNLPMKGMFVDYQKLYADTEALLKLARMDYLSPKQHVRPLNSGQMQMISLLRAYVKKPRILILDEPTSSLTEKEVDTLMEILDNLRKTGTSSLYISHKLDEIYRICDRVQVIRDGQTISNHFITQVDQNTLVEDMVGRKVENLYPKKETVIGEELLRVEHLSMPHPSKPGKLIVDDVSFCVHRGEILGIGGLVGAGRSETIGAIFGQYDKGVTKEVYVKGQKVEIHKPLDAIRYHIGMITEERKLSGIVPMLSIRDNIALASLPKLSGKIFMNKKQVEEETGKQFRSLLIKAPSMDTKLFALSGGNQQKVILGKWLLNDPEILFVDEPTKGIDVGTKADFYTLLGDLAAKGVAIVMVSSDMPELISMSDRCLVLSEGKLTAELRKGEITETAVMKAAIL